MGMVCVQRTLDHGRLCGLVSACGLTVAAAFWCVVAAQGLSRVAELVAGREPFFMVGLGVFLVVAGILGLIRGSRPAEQGAPNCCGRLASQFVSSLLGVLLNPITFLTMTAVLAILGGIPARLNVQDMASLAVAVFLGGMTLWLGITYGVGLMKARLGQTGGERLSKVLNGVILVLGLVYVARPFWSNGMG